MPKPNEVERLDQAWQQLKEANEVSASLNQFFGMLRAFVVETSLIPKEERTYVLFLLVEAFGFEKVSEEGS